MFQLLEKADFGKLSADARIYCRPTCFVDRPHELDEDALRIGDTMVWFASWHISIRDRDIVKSAIIAAPELDDWITGLPDTLVVTLVAQRDAVARPRGNLALGARSVRLSEPQLMGILNATPDSFSDGGKYVDATAAIDAGFAMASEGAAIVDVGGESTRPGAPLIWEGDEIERVQTVIAGLAKGGVAVSVDTRKAAVMEAALSAGASMVNDISALRYDERAMEVVAKSGCALVLMHAPSVKSDPHEGGSYAHVLLDVYDLLAERVAACIAGGIDSRRILVDPGIGFGKGIADNLALINGLALFHTLGCPLVFGASRKRMIGALDNEAPVDQRLGGTVALHYQAASQGAQFLRVHEIAENRQALRVWRGLRDAALVS